MAMNAKADQRPTATSRRMLKRDEVARILSCSLSTLARWAGQRKGPPFIKLDDGPGAVRYPEDLFNEWLTQRTKATD
jgi:predicted DNA-binding transcriptional regulator AlpA